MLWQILFFFPSFRYFTGRNLSFILIFRVADPVHFWLDPDPANQNLENRIRILLALTKNQFKHLNLLNINHISSDIWMIIIFIWKNGTIYQKMCKTSILEIFFPCFYNFTLPKYRSNLPNFVRRLELRPLSTYFK